MKALLLYEPLFQYLCELNRLARGGYRPAYASVRQDIRTLLIDINDAAQDDPELREHVRLLKTPVNYLIDGLIVQNKRLEFRLLWQNDRFGFREDGLAGDEAFFSEYLQPALDVPPTPEEAERLLVYYVGLGLGFRGIHFDEPEKLRAYMRRLRSAVQPWLVDDGVKRLVPQAYEFTDVRDLARPPRLKRSLLVAGLIALLLSVVPLYWWLARSVIQRADQQIHLREISESYQGAPFAASREKQEK